MTDVVIRSTAPDVQFVVQLGQRIPYTTYEYVAHRLLIILNDVQTNVIGKDHAPEWVIPDEATVRMSATPNGVSGSDLRHVVSEVRRGFESTDLQPGEQIKWPPGVGPAAQRAIKEIVGRLRTDLEAITIIADDDPPLTLERAPTAGQLRHLRGYIEYGEVDGVLDLLSVRGNPFFSIKEHNTGRSIRCTFPDEYFGRVKAALEPHNPPRVVVEGMISYKRDGTPVSIREIKDFFVRPPETRPLREIAGSLPNFTRGALAGDYIRRMRGRE